MRRRFQRRVLALFLLLASIAVAVAGDDVIRLRPAPVEDDAPVADAFGLARRGFDYQSFEGRLKSLWFQRKTLMADGRYDDAERQSRLIRAFCAEEGVQRLEGMAGALVAESRRFLEEGHYQRALDSLNLAEAFDPGRPQIHLARATVLWESRRGHLGIVAELVAALRAALVSTVRDFSLFNQLAMVFVVALIGCVAIFSGLMMVRYNVPLRHEVEEWMAQAAGDRWAKALGWAAVFLPLVTWFGAGWIALYWIAVTFRFMRRAERFAATALLVGCVFAVPAYRMAVAMFGMAADPVVRTTLASAGGEYDPDRILKLQELVQVHPEDPVYHFLLAGLYKNGRYFEEAYAHYRMALELDPVLEQAHVNVGNIFYTTGQYPDAIASYNRALEIRPDLVAAYFNRHLAQSESFRFKAAAESLELARQIDSEQLGGLMARASLANERPTVVDAPLAMVSIWGSAFDGREIVSHAGFASARELALRPAQLLNPISLLACFALLACCAIGLFTESRNVARRCIRCGRPFCHYCKSGREGHEYCSQCLHLFVRGDGLAPETKTRKLYEVQRHERLTRKLRRLLSLVLPGSGQLLKGRAGWGCVLLLLWLAALIAWQPVTLLPFERVAGLDLRVDLLGTTPVPDMYALNPFALFALLAMLLIWFTGNVWRWER